MGERHLERQLLEDIARQAGCLYLSDLRLKAHRTAVRQAVEQCEPAQYPLRQWADLAAYLLDEECSFADCDQAKEHLLAAL